MKDSLSSGNSSVEELKKLKNLSKVLMPIGTDNRPILDYLLINAKKAGYQQIFLIVGEQSDRFKSFYGIHDSFNSYNGLQIHYATQYIPEGRRKPFGTGDALFQALEQYPELRNETFTVCNSDNLYSSKALEALRKNGHSNAFISYDRDGLEFENDKVSGFALISTDEKNYLKDIVEKPSPAEFDDYRDECGRLRVSMNLFKLHGPSIYPFLKRCPVHAERNEKELPTAILNMCKHDPNELYSIPLSEHVPDLTLKEDIEKLKEFINNEFK